MGIASKWDEELRSIERMRAGVVIRLPAGLEVKQALIIPVPYDELRALVDTALVEERHRDERAAQLAAYLKERP